MYILLIHSLSIIFLVHVEYQALGQCWGSIQEKTMQTSVLSQSWRLHLCGMWCAVCTHVQGEGVQAAECDHENSARHGEDRCFAGAQSWG